MRSSVTHASAGSVKRRLNHGIDIIEQERAIDGDRERLVALVEAPHIAIQEKLDGKLVHWLEHVNLEQYEGRAGGR
jgi:hypothetical protein